MAENGQVIVLFGSTGDLARRKLFPAIFELFRENKLSINTGVLCLGRSDLSAEQFNRMLLQSLLQQIEEEEEKIIKLYESFIEHFTYFSIDIVTERNFSKLNKIIFEMEEKFKSNGNRLFYLSVFPEHFKKASANIKNYGLLTDKGWNRLIIEKPFGYNLTSAIELNSYLETIFNSKDIFRIDHFLTKNIINQLLTVRFNPDIDPFWNNDYIEKITINLSESIGIEDRGRYFDSSGTLRDMVQNHILQTIALLTIDVPSENEDISEKKLKVIKSLQPFTPEEVNKYIIRGQYVAGNMDGSDLIPYEKECHVKNSSMTETFVAGTLFVNNSRWSGVPLRFRTGKRLQTKTSRIEVSFKRPTKLSISEDSCISIVFDENKKILIEHENKIVYHTFPENSYANSLLNALSGNLQFFVTWEETAASWKFIDQITNAWELDIDNLIYYESGTNGPTIKGNFIE
ncbi:glucose-6-phosphate dehydrogenase [Sporosarcina sp. FSL K6-1508]|uniref:glucose-6-phosphate dehydrogenase n=1 Tax=Sporosarcina sp. FSL K6-1508 TaxID=2921553 RepID=UPI0030F67A46